MKSLPILLGVLATALVAQEKPSDVSAGRARANFARPITLAADDVRQFPEPPRATATFRPRDFMESSSCSNTTRP